MFQHYDEGREGKMKGNAIQDTLRQLSQTFFQKLQPLGFSFSLFFFAQGTVKPGTTTNTSRAKLNCRNAGPRDFATMEG